MTCYLLILELLIHEERNMEKLAPNINLYMETLRLLLKYKALSAPFLMRKLKVTESCANKLMEEFKSKGYIDEKGILREDHARAT